jgi:hypothetical protein
MCVTRAAYAPMMVSLTTFFQNNLFKDDETEGLKMGLYASACFAAASFLYSLVLPLIIKGVGVKVAYLSSQVIATGCYVSLFFLDSFPGTYINSRLRNFMAVDTGGSYKILSRD